jgi:hypothetical protein
MLAVCLRDARGESEARGDYVGDHVRRLQKRWPHGGN